MVDSILTHLPLDKIAAFSQTVFSNAFSWMKSFVFLLTFLGLALNRQKTIIWTNADPILGGDELMPYDPCLYISSPQYQTLCCCSVSHINFVIFIDTFLNFLLCRKLWNPLPFPLWWCHNGHDSISNHQPHDCLLNRLFRRRSNKTSKLSVTGLCAGNSPPRTNGQ